MSAWNVNCVTGCSCSQDLEAPDNPECREEAEADAIKKGWTTSGELSPDGCRLFKCPECSK